MKIVTRKSQTTWMNVSLPLCIIVTLTQTLVTNILFDTRYRESQAFDIYKETVYLLDKEVFVV